MSNPRPFRIAQLSDLHLMADPDAELAGWRTMRSFQRILQHLQNSQPQPDALLLTGDVSQDASIASYHHVRECLSPLGIPTYWLPGNHDIPDLMAQTLSQEPFQSRKSCPVGEWQMILLDSTIPNHVEGRLSEATLAGLVAELQQTDRPTLVALHHPPFPIHSDWMDKISLHEPESLWQVLADYPQVRLVIAGHVHQEARWQNDRVQYLTAPSTCHQFKPLSAELAIDSQDPGYRLLFLYGDGHWETEVVRVSTSEMAHATSMQEMAYPRQEHD